MEEVGKDDRNLEKNISKISLVKVLVEKVENYFEKQEVNVSIVLN